MRKSNSFFTKNGRVQIGDNSKKSLLLEILFAFDAK